VYVATKFQNDERFSESEGNGLSSVSHHVYFHSVKILLLQWHVQYRTRAKHEVARVVEIQTLAHIRVQVIGLDLATQAVRVREQQRAAVSIGGFEMVVIKTVHDEF